jgi:RNA polymerase sigma-70 factor (ECF subfamily)
MDMERSYRQWTDEHQDRVWSLALYVLGERAEAEDVVQEAFTRLWQHRDSMSDAHVGPWLLRVARNLCLDRIRQRRPGADPEELAATEGSAPDAGLERGRLAARLQQAVACLAEPYRSLIILRDIQQHSYQDVAGVTGLSMPQVKTYLHRARRQLREQLLEWQA